MNIVGRPILAAAGFQPALAVCEESRRAGSEDSRRAGSEDSRRVRTSRLKGGCRQDCLPHKEYAF
jgi:hypothetical protein